MTDLKAYVTAPNDARLMLLPGHEIVGQQFVEIHVVSTYPGRNRGLFSIARFGPDPFTESGRLTQAAIRTFLEGMFGQSRH